MNFWSSSNPFSMGMDLYTNHIINHGGIWINHRLTTTMYRGWLGTDWSYILDVDVVAKIYTYALLCRVLWLFCALGTSNIKFHFHYKLLNQALPHAHGINNIDNRSTVEIPHEGEIDGCCGTSLHEVERSILMPKLRKWGLNGNVGQWGITMSMVSRDEE
jgi:hypothetical protein